MAGKAPLMSAPSIPWRFLTFAETEADPQPDGRQHQWFIRPNTAQSDSLVFVQAQLVPGTSHGFHHHPEMDEIIYVLGGEMEQWIEEEKRTLRRGDAVYIQRGVIHGSYNVSSAPVDFLAILSPAKISGPMTVEVADQEPWSSLRGKI